MTEQAPKSEVPYPPLGDGHDDRERLHNGLLQHFQPEGLAEQLGFRGCKNADVADVGCRQGDYFPLIGFLGARSIVGIDPFLKDEPVHAQAEAIRKILYRSGDVPTTFINGDLLDAAIRAPHSIDVALAFNVDPRINREDFADGLLLLLRPGGQAVVTIAEPGTNDLIDALTDRFEGVASSPAWADEPRLGYETDDESRPIWHETMVIATAPA